MAKIKSYRDLIAWQKAYQSVLDVYTITKAFPADERFGLTQQVQRAAVSIASNIAEGWGRSSRVEYARFLDMARGSAYELQTQLWIAGDLGYIAKDHPIHESIAEVERIINGLIRALRSKKE